MCHSIATIHALQQAIPNTCTAKTLGPGERLTLGVQALAGQQTITGLANDVGVSRKFVSLQRDRARAALDIAFAPSTDTDDQVLFHLPITKSWLQQAALGLTLICHSSYRGVHEFFRDLLHVDMAVGTVHNIIQDAIAKARLVNQKQDLAKVQIAGLDEIFQNRQPVLVGADIHSSYCFLLSAQEQRDGDSWALCLMDCQGRGLAPRAAIADFGTGLRTGLQRAMPQLTCRGDVFHARQKLALAAGILDNRAYDAIAAHDKFQRQWTRMHQQGRSDQIKQRGTLGHKVNAAALTQAKAIALADDVAILARWLGSEVLAVNALPYADRCALFDFIVAQLQRLAQASSCPQLRSAGSLLNNHREELLAFALQLDEDLAQLAAGFEVSLDSVRALLELQTLEPRSPLRWQKEKVLRQQLRGRYYDLEQAVRALRGQVVRASSIIENINSRLRGYFFLRREVGSGYLELLQFFLNHRRFLRSERAERVGKSPAELLNGQSHPHWLEMLGYRRASSN